MGEVDGEGRSRQHQKTILNGKLQKSAILKTQTAQTVLETTHKHLNSNLWQVSGKGLWILCPEKGTLVMETQGLTVRYLQEAPLSLSTRNHPNLGNNSSRRQTMRRVTLLPTSSPPT